MAENEVKVGIGDLNLVKSPDKIMTIGLGSCIGIMLYNKKTLVAGLAHIMLPDSTQFKKIDNPLKFPDLAIPILVDKMIKAGCRKSNMTAKIAGGASMFAFSDKSMISDIGTRNGEAVKKILKEMSIPILAEHLGGNKGRTMIVDSLTGNVTLKIVGQGLIEI